jgi:hypothetical protein
MAQEEASSAATPATAKVAGATYSPPEMRKYMLTSPLTPIETEVGNDRLPFEWLMRNSPSTRASNSPSSDRINSASRSPSLARPWHKKGPLAAAPRCTDGPCEPDRRGLPDKSNCAGQIPQSRESGLVADMPPSRPDNLRRARKHRGADGENCIPARSLPWRDSDTKRSPSYCSKFPAPTRGSARSLGAVGFSLACVRLR